jgi:hypothetical protein
MYALQTPYCHAAQTALLLDQDGKSNAMLSGSHSLPRNMLNQPSPVMSHA